MKTEKAAPSTKVKKAAPSTQTDAVEAPIARTDRVYRARPRRREFLVMVADLEDSRPSGFGLTLDEVIDDIVRVLRATDPKGGDPRGTHDDLVV